METGNDNAAEGSQVASTATATNPGPLPLGNGPVAASEEGSVAPSGPRAGVAGTETQATSADFAGNAEAPARPPTPSSRKQSQSHSHLKDPFVQPAAGPTGSPAGPRPNAGHTSGSTSSSPGFSVRQPPQAPLVLLPPNSSQVSPSLKPSVAGDVKQPVPTFVSPVVQPAVPVPTSRAPVPALSGPQKPPPPPAGQLPISQQSAPPARKRLRLEGDDTEPANVPVPSAIELEQKQQINKLNFELNQAKQQIERQTVVLERTKAEFDKQVKCQLERFNFHLSQEKAILERHLQTVKDMLLEARLKYASELQAMATEHKQEVDRLRQQQAQLRQEKLDLEMEKRNAQQKAGQVEVAAEVWKTKALQREVEPEDLQVSNLQNELQAAKTRAAAMQNQAASAQEAAKKWVTVISGEDPALSTPESVVRALRAFKAQLEARAPNAQVKQLEAEHQKLQNESRTWAATLRQIDPALKTSHDLLKKVAELKAQCVDNSVIGQKEQELSASLAERNSALELAQKALTEREELLAEKQARIEKLEAEKQQLAQVNISRFKSALEKANARAASAEKERDVAKQEADALKGKGDVTSVTDTNKRLEFAEKSKANLQRQLELMQEKLEKAASGDKAKGPDLITQKYNKELKERARMLEEELQRVTCGTKLKEQDEQIKKLTTDLSTTKSEATVLQTEKERLEKRISELEKAPPVAGPVGPPPLRFLSLGHDGGFPKRQ